MSDPPQVLDPAHPESPRSRARDIPPPSVALRFGLSATERPGLLHPWTGTRGLEVDSARLGPSAALFETRHGLIKEENRTRMSPALRLRRAEAIATQLAAPIETLLVKTAKDAGGVPEPPGQHRLLDTLDTCLDGLADSLRLTLQDAWESGGKRPPTDLLAAAACRLLDLLHCRQRLRVLRHQCMETRDWQTANLVFTAIAGLGATQMPGRALFTPGASGSGDDTTSTGQLYERIQIIGLFDACAWPARYQQVITAYLAQIDQAIGIRFAQSPAGGSGLRFAHPYLNQPPLRSPFGETVIVFDITRLLAAVRIDWRHLDDQTVTGGWRPALAERSPATRRAVLALLAHDLGVADIDVPRQPMATARGELRMQVGMDAVRNHLRAIFAGSGLMREQMQLFEAFAGSSAAIGEDQASADESQWRVSAYGPPNLAAQTKATRYTRPIRVGAPVVIGIGSEGLKQPKLGYIDRIERDAQGLMRIRLTILARFATLVQARKADPDPDQKGPIERIGCLLVYNNEEGWGLLTPPQTQFTTGSRVAIRTKRLRVDARLRELLAITPELMLFRLRQADLGLSPPNYPGARPLRHRRPPRPNDRTDEREHLLRDCG